MKDAIEIEKETGNEVDDDDIMDDDDSSGMGRQFPWFRRVAPPAFATFAVAAFLFAYASVCYARRVDAQKRKFGAAEFKGSLRFCAKVSAYGDNDDPTFSVARLVTKSLIFLGMLQLDYGKGFLVMLGCLAVESSLEVARVLIAYRSCRSLHDVRATSDDEAKDIAASTVLEPTNIYEDLTRPSSIAIMVFLVQFLLIGCVMYDSYTTPTRSCFDGTDGCPMLSSAGSYCLYCVGVFMACVFYVGPMNSYGKKEHDPVFWLKLFLMSKQNSSVISWKDSVTDQNKTMRLRQNDWRIWARFAMSFVVNSVCFHFLLHVLPIQIASKSSVMGVVFSSVGMIYLVDLDDTAGTTMTLVSDESNHALPNVGGDGTNGYGSTGNGDDSGNLDTRKQMIVQDALNDVKIKLEALASSSAARPGQAAAISHGVSDVRIQSVAQALFLSAQKKREGESSDSNTGLNGEGTALVV